MAFGPWNPGLDSTIPQDVLPLSTMFRADNVETGFAEAQELADFSGLSAFEAVAFRPERLVVHEVLVRVTADLSVPDGPEYEELGLNLRAMAGRLIEHHVEPRLDELKRVHQGLKETAAGLIGAELVRLRAPSKPTLVADKPSLIQRLLGKARPAGPAAAVSVQDRLTDLETRALQATDPIQRACLSALARVIESVARHRGTLVGDNDTLISLAVTLVANELGSQLLGEALDPIIAAAAPAEGYTVLPPQEKPVIMNVKGASASGKSTIRPQQRALAARLEIPWEDFALVSPDYWRKYLLEYESLGPNAKYGAMLTGHELAIVDGKLDRHMAIKAAANALPHLLIDRFRFDSFIIKDDHDEDSQLLTRFGDLVYMFFMITPPEETVERAWKRGLTTGRYKAVDDLLDHNIEAYTGMPSLFFSWALSKKKKVHYEFLDNDVPLGQRPRTVAFGWNGEMVVLDVAKLLDIERFKKINVDADGPDGVRITEEMPAELNVEFLNQCASRVPSIEFAEQKSGRIYGVLERGEWVWRDMDFAAGNMSDPDTLAGLQALGWNDTNAGIGADVKPRILRDVRNHTLGEWGSG